MNDELKVWAVDGTSFSAPTVTAMLQVYARWREDTGQRDLTVDEIESFVYNEALDILDSGYDTASGYGLFRLPDRIPEIEKVVDTMEKRPCAITLANYHHTAGNEANAAAIRAEHMLPKSQGGPSYGDIGYNWVIRKDGTIEKGRDIYYSGAHNPALAPDGSGYTMNQRSVSIVCIGNFDNEQMTEAQFQGLLKKSIEVHKQFGLKIVDHSRHCDQYATACPGKNFPWSRLMLELYEAVTEKEEYKVKKVVAVFTAKDLTTGSNVADDLGGVAIFNRNGSPTAHPDVYAAEKVYTVGGGRLYPENDPREEYMSGKDAFGTMAAVAKAKAEGKF